LKKLDQNFKILEAVRMHGFWVFWSKDWGSNDKVLVQLFQKLVGVGEAHGLT